MKKISAFVLASALAMMQSASADSLWWGYGDGENVEGGVGAASSSTWTAAIKMTKAVADSYAGATITAVRFAVYGNGQTVKNCSYFVTDDIKKIENPIAVGDLTMGWHEYQLAEPYTIEAGKELYIGYMSTGVYPIAQVSGEGSEGTAVIGSGTRFTDYGVVDGYNWILAIQAQVTGDNFPASLAWQNIKPMKAEADHENLLTFALQSVTPTDVTSFDAELRIDNEVVDSKHVSCDLQEAYDAASVSFTLPALGVGNYSYTVAVTAINDEPLDAPVEASAQLEVVQYLMVRKHVVEECTGTWCGWCIRGLVAMREMRAKYPDTFIGIAVHGSDAFSTSSYNALLNRASGYPSAFINRSTSIGTNPSEMEAAFRAEDQTANGEVKIVEARFTDATKKKLNIKVTTRFALDYNTENFRMAFVVLEDYLRSTQSNYYAGGGNGPMGGFENQSSTVYVDLMDVARDIKNYAGLTNSVPAQITAGEVYEYTYTYTLPTTIKDQENVSIVALLQNKQGSKIVNADKTETLLAWDAEVEGIEAVRADDTAQPACFDLQGRPMAAPVVGQPYVSGGRVRLNR